MTSTYDKYAIMLSFSKILLNTSLLEVPNLSIQEILRNPEIPNFGLHCSNHSRILEHPTQLGIQSPGFQILGTLKAHLLDSSIFQNGPYIGMGGLTIYPSIYKVDENTKDWYKTCGFNSNAFKVRQVLLIELFKPDLIELILTSYLLRNLNT